MKRKPTDVALEARLRELRARVHPEPSVADQVAAELRRRADAEREARKRQEADRYRGGPCYGCSATTSVLMRNGCPTNGFRELTVGVVLCARCRSWIGGSGSLDELRDRAAAILLAEGMAGLRLPNRKHFTGLRDGLAAELGVELFGETTDRPGRPWSHLQPVADRLDAEALDREAFTASMGDGPTFDQMILAGVGLGPPPPTAPFGKPGDLVFPPIADDSGAEVNRLARERWA